MFARGEGASKTVSRFEHVLLFSSLIGCHHCILLHDVWSVLSSEFGKTSFLADLKSIILCGIETQACVQATALDLLEDDFDVHVIADAVSSRSLVDRCGKTLLRHLGLMFSFWT